MNFKEMKAKTKISVVGIVNQINVYVVPDGKANAGKEYHSVDLIVEGSKDMVNIRLPERYNPADYVEGTLVSIPFTISTFNGRVNLDAKI